MEENELMAIDRFVVDCNDMISGRFLDFTKRLEKLLSVMALSESLVDLLASSLENFDENDEMAKAFSLDKKTGMARVNLPTDDKKKMALITSLFNRITSRALNSTQFLETFFGGEVRQFLQQILVPYRDAICKAFSIPTDLTADEIVKKQIESLKNKEKEVPEKEKESEEEQLPGVKELFAEIEKKCNQILSLLQFEKKHESEVGDVEFVVEAILEECKNSNLMTVNALSIGLCYAAKKLKNVRHIVEDLQSTILEYYDYLASLTQGDSKDEDESDEFDESEDFED